MRLRIIIALVISAVLGVLAAWPIYQTPRLWLVALAATLLGAGLIIARKQWKIPIITLVALGLAAFLILALTIAVPSAWHDLPGSLGAGLVDVLASIVLGWKQLLTLELPVGSYQAMLMPFFIVITVSSCAAMLLRKSRFAAIPLIVPVVWGTVFGASAVSDPLTLGPLTIVAPREVSLWIIAAAGASFWVWFVSGTKRRAALKRGGGSEKRAARPIAAALTLALAAGVSVALLPLVNSNARTVPRDKVDPQIVINKEPSALAAYRTSKEDEQLDEDLFTITSDGALPERLTLVTLDEYDGIDFNVSQSEAGQFTRFPSGGSVAESAEVTVTVDNYRGIWAPIAAPLSSTPEFEGERSRKLSDSFYVNRGTGTAIAVPTGRGLSAGDSYTIGMSTAAAPQVAAPVSSEAQVDLEAMPQLAEWLERQGTRNVTELVENLRDEGYLSHSLTKSSWLEKLEGVKFISTPGGHSESRVEELFEQLNKNPDTVAGIGDDEQFAAAAALVAQAVGYDSRVVLGFRLTEGVPGIPACDRVCTGENLAAWIEVSTENGWAPIDVSPQIEEPPSTLREGEQLPEFPTVPEERDAKPVDPPAGLGDQNDNEREPNETDELAWLWPVLKIAGLSILGLLCLLVPLLLIPVAKRIRKRRRRAAAAPQVRALGAWNELRDRAIDWGVPLPVTRGRSTGDPLGEAGGSRLAQAQLIGSPVAVEIADAVGRAVYSSGEFTLEEADELWQKLDDELKLHKNNESFIQSLRSAYSLRSLGVPRIGRKK
ncbi:MAG: DUF3488 domain-containing protein [Canibacter sp.]